MARSTLQYQRAYERKRRARCRVNGICVQCGTAPKRKGLAPNGRPYSRCRRCIERLARFNARYERERRRRGICKSCPRKRPPGDRRVECLECREQRNASMREKYRLYGRLRKAA